MQPEPQPGVAAEMRDDPAPAQRRARPDALPDPQQPAPKPRPTLAAIAARHVLDLSPDPGQGDFWTVRSGKTTVFAGARAACLRFLDGCREGNGGLIQ